MPILVDYNANVIPPMMVFMKDLKEGGDYTKQVDIIRHVVLSSLLLTKKKHGKQYGDMIICTDCKGDYWRKKIFKYYKANRKNLRKKSKIDWKVVFDTLSELQKDLYEIFPYKVIEVEEAEADDIIGVLTKYFQTNELTRTGLIEEPQPIMIASSDQDNLQLHRYKNVSQWSLKEKKKIKPKINAKCSLIEKICVGDAGDGIPNIMSGDDVLITEGVRQKSFRKDRLENFYRLGIDACVNDEERRNYQRNEQLISYEHIPESLQEQIITIYKESVIKGHRYDIMQYLMKNRCRQLMESLGDF